MGVKFANASDFHNLVPFQKQIQLSQIDTKWGNQKGISIDLKKSDADSLILMEWNKSSLMIQNTLYSRNVFFLE